MVNPRRHDVPAQPGTAEQQDRDEPETGDGERLQPDERESFEDDAMRERDA